MNRCIWKTQTLCADVAHACQHFRIRQIWTKKKKIHNSMRHFISPWVTNTVQAPDLVIVSFPPSKGNTMQMLWGCSTLCRLVPANLCMSEWGECLDYTATKNEQPFIAKQPCFLSSFQSCQLSPGEEMTSLFAALQQMEGRSSPSLSQTRVPHDGVKTVLI